MSSYTEIRQERPGQANVLYGGESTGGEDELVAISWSSGKRPGGGKFTGGTHTFEPRTTLEAKTK